MLNCIPIDNTRYQVGIKFQLYRVFHKKEIIIIREIRNKQGKIGEETSDKLVSAEHLSYFNTPHKNSQHRDEN